MTAQQPPQTSANTAALAKNAKDVRVPMGTCPLMNEKLQLLPLRYGLVEHLDPAGELPMPFKTTSQPLGLRLLRDGYLYIIDEAFGYLHEYRIEQGQISKLLWNSQEVFGDTRTSSIGEPHLVFARKQRLHACYSEIQWTAFKCSQLLKSSDERKRLMQPVTLASACPEKGGGANLLSQRQVQQWLAEVNEQPSAAHALPEGANPEESQAYHWEEQPLFEAVAIEALTSQVQGPYKDDYLFLVLRDDIGVMRDLAKAQLKVADWIEHWSEDETCQGQYLTGSYIQSLYEVNAARLTALSATDPDIKALQDETTGPQQASIQDYLKARREQPDAGVYGDEAQWREAAWTNPHAKAFIAMTDALGQALYQKHQGAINTLSLHTWEALHGKELGQRGIDDLVNRAAMEAFVARQQKLLSHWHARLQKIRADRLAMFVSGRFHEAAWYYDFNLDEQIRHRLETEFVCVAAICADQEALEKMAAYLDAHLVTVVPGLDTLALADQVDIAKKLADLSDFTIKLVSLEENLASVNALANQFNSLMNQRLPNYARLNTQFMGLQSLLQEAYNPARQLKLADELDNAHQAFKRTQHIDPNNYIRAIGAPARLQLLREFSRQGLTLRAASGAEIAAFQLTQTQSMDLRSQLKETYRLHNSQLRSQATGFAAAGSDAPYNQRIERLKNALISLEDRLSGALVVGGRGPAQIGTVVDGLTPQLRTEMDRTLRDYRATGTFNKPLMGAIQSKGDGIAFGLFVIQGLKFLEAMSTLIKKPDRSWADLIVAGEAFFGMSGAGFAMVQGLSVTIFQAHMTEMESAAGKLNSMSRLGRWTGIAGLGAFVLGGIAASFDLSKHSLRWGDALAKGDYPSLGASTVQISGDAVLLGTNTWAAKHTGSIIKNIMNTPKELRPLAWAEASPRLVAIGARANLIGLIGSALQLLGEGLYNYFYLDDLQTWMHSSLWGRQTAQRSVEAEWTALARVVQQPTCELVRNDKKTYLKLVLPGVSTAELDSRLLQLLIYERRRDTPFDAPYNPNPPPLRWHESTAEWGSQCVVASTGQQALTLHLPIANCLHTSRFALALTLGYQLEAGRDLSHRSRFVLYDLRVMKTHGQHIPLNGNWALAPVDSLPAGTEDGELQTFKREDLVSGDV